MPATLRLWGGYAWVAITILACSNEKPVRTALRTKTEARVQFHADLINHTINESLFIPLTDSSESRWQGAFWAMELSGHRSALTDSAIQVAMKSFPHHSPGFQRTLLEVIYTLYPQGFSTEILGLLDNLDSEKLFAMTATYLFQDNPEAYETHVFTLMQERFPDWQNHPILLSFHRSLTNNQLSPPVHDLIQASFIPGVPVFLSFQPENRDYSGLVICRDQTGKFLLDINTGDPLVARQLGRAVTNLPWYLTNGNTPPGIYSVVRMDISSNVFIGPTPNLQLGMPFEVSPDIFFENDQIGPTWNESLYKDLLPESWKNFAPIWGSYFAGKAGRSEIIAHGSTINPEFYNQLPCYPLTPSLGCLTGLEHWSESDGSLLGSDQQILIDMYQLVGMDQALLIVIPIEGANHNLGMRDVMKYLFAE